MTARLMVKMTGHLMTINIDLRKVLMSDTRNAMIHGHNKRHEWILSGVLTNTSEVF